MSEVHDEFGSEIARHHDVRRRLEAEVAPVATSLDGRAFTFQAPVALPIQVGGYVQVESDHGPLLGQVLERELVRQEGPEVAATGADDLVFRSRISFSSTRGRAALLGDGALFHDAALKPAGANEVAAWLGRSRPRRARLAVGEALFAPGVPVELDAGGFDRHTFLCGQSGSGKSYSLGVILEQLLLESELRIVVLDPNSDYIRLRKTRPDTDPSIASRWAQRAQGVGVRTAETEGDERLRLRFFDLDGPTQAAVAGLDPLRDREEYGALLTLIEKEASGLSYEELQARLVGGEDPEFHALALRIRNLRILDWPLWTRRRDDRGLLGDLDRDDWRCLVVDLGSVVDARERALVSAAVLGQLWARRAERRPLLVVIDEAHNVCPQEPPEELTALATDHAVRIAAEGRKFGLYLLVSTQRPEKVHENVLSQCDNLVLMRMNSPSDLAHLAGLFSFAPASLLARSAVFRQGEALIAGKLVSHPIFVRFGTRVAEEGGSDVSAAWAELPSD